MKKEKAITLISLVITIVVLIILSSVAIYLSLGNNGIFTRAREAKEITNKQEATDIINLKITTAQMNKYAEEQRMPTLKELSEALIDDEIEYVTEKSQVASTKYEVGENPVSIFTKLNDYPYEFEINSSLQLASINGVKIAKNEQKYLFDYSKNEERIVGKWVDGKNVYEKFLDIGNATQYGMVYDVSDITNNKNIEISIPNTDICNNFDKIISGQVRVDRGTLNNGIKYIMPFSWSGFGAAFCGIYQNYEKNSIVLNLGDQYRYSGNKNIINFQILIQYTKTND